MREFIKPTILTWVMMLPIFAGVWMYSRGSESITLFNKWLRIDKSATTISLPDWLPNYVWWLFLVTGTILLRKSWHKILLSGSRAS